MIPTNDFAYCRVFSSSTKMGQTEIGRRYNGMVTPSRALIYANQVDFRKKEKGFRHLHIRPSSLLCTSSPEEIYSNNVQQQSYTWKFHRPRPKSVRYFNNFLKLFEA
ncbi:hypothetical protein WA026_002068 [Henosepilachna vigintioctopunctata]|uniref:Uncharacterized protein n=1 Tax=Henosepilachna vigintioctopunctata TaxID=420089 RepID=A0AAW1TZT5_9CUCU